MSIPRQLVKSFDIIHNCKLVVTKSPTEDNLKEFGKALNNSIPDESNQISYMIYKFMRKLYLRDKTRFVNYISDIQYHEAMILWTDYDDILNFFELTGTIFLGWNKSVNKYQAAKIDPTKKRTESSTELKPTIKPSIESSELKPTADPWVQPIKPNVEFITEGHVRSVEQTQDYDVIYTRIAQIQANMLYQP